MVEKSEQNEAYVEGSFQHAQQDQHDNLLLLHKREGQVADAAALYYEYDRRQNAASRDMDEHQAPQHFGSVQQDRFQFEHQQYMNQSHSHQQDQDEMEQETAEIHDRMRRTAQRPGGGAFNQGSYNLQSGNMRRQYTGQKQEMELQYNSFDLPNSYTRAGADSIRMQDMN